LSGALVKETYPSGRVVRNEFESDGDLSRIYGKVNQNATERTYANGFSYTADGTLPSNFSDSSCAFAPVRLNNRKNPKHKPIVNVIEPAYCRFNRRFENIIFPPKITDGFDSRSLSETD
jgi:hypothetical protein